jgi:hypothetical protein
VRPCRATMPCSDTPTHAARPESLDGTLPRRRSRPVHRVGAASTPCRLVHSRIGRKPRALRLRPLSRGSDESPIRGAVTLGGGNGPRRSAGGTVAPRNPSQELGAPLPLSRAAAPALKGTSMKLHLLAMAALVSATTLAAAQTTGSAAADTSSPTTSPAAGALAGPAVGSVLQWRGRCRGRQRRLQRPGRRQGTPGLHQQRSQRGTSTGASQRGAGTREDRPTIPASAREREREAAKTVPRRVAPAFRRGAAVPAASEVCRGRTRARARARGAEHANGQGGRSGLHWGIEAPA